MNRSRDSRLEPFEDGWWFAREPAFAAIVEIGDPELATEAFRLLADRWRDDPRGENDAVRVVLVDGLAELSEAPVVQAELRRVLEDSTHPPDVRVRCLAYLLRCGAMSPEWASPDRFGGGGSIEVSRVVGALLEVDAEDVARAYVGRYGTPHEQTAWQFIGPQDVAALGDAELQEVGERHESWLVRKWVAAELMERGLAADGLAVYEGLFPTPVGEATRAGETVIAETEAIDELERLRSDPRARRALALAACSASARVVQRAVAALTPVESEDDLAPLVSIAEEHGRAGWPAAIALARSAGNDATVERLTGELAQDVRRTATAPFALLRALGLVDVAGDLAEVLIAEADTPAEPMHVIEAMSALLGAEHPRAAEIIEPIARGGRDVPPRWQDWYLQKEARRLMGMDPGGSPG